MTDRHAGCLPADVRVFLADVSGGRTVTEAAADAELWHGSADTDNERMADLALQAARLLEKYEGPYARLIVETETAGSYQVWHHGQLVVPEAELAKPPDPADFRLYCRELLPGKYELGWERKP